MFILIINIDYDKIDNRFLFNYQILFHFSYSYTSIEARVCFVANNINSIYNLKMK